MTTQYFKAQGTNGTKFYAVYEDELISQFYLDDMKVDNVHIDSDRSWHYHSYDFDLLDGLDFEDVLELVKKAIDNTGITYGATVQEFDEDAQEFEDVEDVKQWLDNEANYYITDTLYSLVNDADNAIKAFTVSGYSQGDGALIWYDTNVTEGTYAPDYVEKVLFSSWFAIEDVNEHGEFDGDILEYVSYMDFDADYMQKHYNATPAQENTLLTLS